MLSKVSSASHPELHRKIVLVQVVVPSREDIPKYQELKLDIERLASQINGEFGAPAWVPVHYIHRHLERPELLALYRAADIALITPLKDGMNLVAKEFCAAQVRDEGVLILSEFAGAADQLRNGAVLVNPYDIEKVADVHLSSVPHEPQGKETADAQVTPQGTQGECVSLVRALLRHTGGFAGITDRSASARAR